MRTPAIRRACSAFAATATGKDGGLRTFSASANRSCVGVETRHSTEAERGHHAALPQVSLEPEADAAILVCQVPNAVFAGYARSQIQSEVPNARGSGPSVG